MDLTWQQSGEDCAERCPRVAPEALAWKRPRVQCCYLRMKVRLMRSESTHKCSGNVEQQ